jgi:hypothetical protein
MMILDLEPARQNRPGRNANRTRLEFKDTIAGTAAKMMVMPTVRRFKMWFLPRQQDLYDRTGLTQQANRAIHGRQTQSRYARTATLEDGRNVQWTFSRLDDLENRLALTGVALRTHGSRISLAK